MAALEIREGFLCPVCMQDLGTVVNLQSHFEEQHSEDKDMLVQLKSLFDKAKKRILKKERDEADGVSSTRDYVSSSNLTSNASLAKKDATYIEFEPQTLGASRSHTDLFKRLRDQRIDRCVIETNKLLIRMDKLLGPDLPSDPGKRKESPEVADSFVSRAFDKAKTLTTKTENFARSLVLETSVEYDDDENPYEKAVVAWTADSEVSTCADCGVRFTLTRRRHHCRLCGGIMCKQCSQFMPVEYARKLTNPSFKYAGRGFHRSNSNGSINSMFSSDGDEHIRTCIKCRTLLERRDQQMEQRNTKPIVVQLYDKMKFDISETDRLLKHFLKMSDSLRMGETTYGIEDANLLRVKIMKLYENIDKLSKSIMKLGTDNPVDEPSAQGLMLQNKIRLYARNYLQDNLIGLQALPTEEEYAKLKKMRQQKIQEKIEAEKQAAAERGRLARLRELREERGSPTHQTHRPADLSVKTHKREGSQGFVQDEGWKPAEVMYGDTDDPMVQQMNIIKGYIKQAKQADRWDEVQIFEANLKELQHVYWLEREKKQRSELQSPMQQGISVPADKAMDTSPVKGANSSQPPTAHIQNIPSMVEQNTKSSQSQVVQPRHQDAQVKTPTSLNPFDDEYDEEHVSDYFSKKKH